MRKPLEGELGEWIQIALRDEWDILLKCEPSEKYHVMITRGRASLGTQHPVSLGKLPTALEELLEEARLHVRES